MSEFISTFEKEAPEIVLEWHDSLSEAEGWLVINSLRGGAAGGGTRMRKGLTRQEVISLAKTMEIKFSVSGPPIGGAKSGINFDPADSRKVDVLRRWYKVMSPILKNYYGTGGDMNIDEIAEVIPITEEFGIWHPQEGIVNGHYQPNEKDKINKIGQLRVGVSKWLENELYTPSKKQGLVVADMITGYGVAESIKHFYKIWKQDSTQGKRVIIQGFGNVGAAAAFFLAQQGVKIIGILDITGGLFCNEGFTIDEVNTLFMERKNRKLYHPKLIPYTKAIDLFWKQKADIMIPAAGSGLLGMKELKAMINSGIQVISSGANVPFKDNEIFYGKILQTADEHLSVIPDFVANCGMARVFAYLMEKNVTITDEAIFEDVSATIAQALLKIHLQNKRLHYITKHALKIAINEISNN